MVWIMGENEWQREEGEDTGQHIIESALRLEIIRQTLKAPINDNLQREL